MVIDNPEILRDAVTSSGAHPTHPGAETIVDEFAVGMNQYSSAYVGVADAEWNNFRGMEVAGNK